MGRTKREKLLIIKGAFAELATYLNIWHQLLPRFFPSFMDEKWGHYLFNFLFDIGAMQSSLLHYSLKLIS
uniref:Uncharacterized protein n=1 Tax=Rhizophora mucronata TaxID=61149 RepID=A0A2P2J0Z0_RHIMU